GRVVGTFCMAINIYGIGQTFRRVGQGDMQNYVELSPVAIQEIRYAVALARTMYIGNQFSREVAAQRVPAATLNRPLGPAFVQALVWTRMAMDNSARFPFPAGSNMPGGWARPGVHPLSVEEVAFWFGHDMVGGQTLAARLSPSDTASIVVTPAFSGTHAPNQDGFIGPFTVNWGASSAQSLIDLAGTPTFSIVQSNLANMVVYDNGDFVPVQYVGIGQEFFVEPRVFGGHDIDLRSNSSIVLSMTEYFFLHGGQPQYGLEFVTWPNQRLRFTREEPNDKFQKAVQEWGTDNPNNWFDHIDVEPDARALFRIVFENTGERDVRLQFSEYPPEDDCCALGGPGPYPEDERILMRPIPIFNAQQLSDMRLSGRNEIDHILMNDICLCIFDNWIAIPGPLRATLYGNGHTIANLTSFFGADHWWNHTGGLFTQLEGNAQIRDLYLRDFDITAVTAVGALASSANWNGPGDVIIDNVHAYNMRLAGVNAIGGLLGTSEIGSASHVTISNSSVQNITIVPHPTQEQSVNFNNIIPQFGGLVGGMRGSIVNSHVLNANITPFDFPSQGATLAGGVGGLIGVHRYGDIENSSATNITINNTTPNNGFGGVAGRSNGYANYNNITVNNFNLNLTNSLNPRPNGWQIIFGGVIGIGQVVNDQNELISMTNVIVDGFTVTTTGMLNHYVNAGGLVGYARDSDVIIQNASVEGLDFNIIKNNPGGATSVAGILNHAMNTTIENVFAEGSIFIHNVNGTANTENVVGGIVSHVEQGSLYLSNAISNIDVEIIVNNNRLVIGGILGQRGFMHSQSFSMSNVVAAGSRLSTSVSSTSTSDGTWVGRIVGMPWEHPFDESSFLAYEDMVLEAAVAYAPWFTSALHGNDATRLELYNRALYDALDFDLDAVWFPPNGSLPRLRNTGAPNFAFPGIDPIGPCDPENGGSDPGNGNGPGGPAPILWVRDYFDGDRLDNDDFLMRVGNTNTFITLREWALQQVADVNAPYHDYVEVDENGDIIRVLVPEGESFTFYYLTEELPVGHFVNIVHIGPPRDSASVTVRERHRANYFYLRVFKYSHSFMDRIAEGWIFRLMRDGVHVAYISHDTNNPIRLITPGQYTLHEVQAPPGHILDPSIIWRFEFTGNDIIARPLPTIDADGTVPGGIEITPEGPNVTVRFIEISVINQPYIEPCPDTVLDFVKTDDYDRPLAGARFALYQRDENNDWVRMGGPNAFTASGPDGRVRFE
ncbi:MAG: hypothetical protein FWC71_12255, partial [Defluviitaleaceae bacterium]|nr:hypothetical protein [Defluviitaleaceae bacterium]